MIKKGDKTIIKAWTFYDWANSVYTLVITTAIFPIFYGAITSTKDPATGLVTYDIVEAFGFSFKNTELMSFTLAASYLIVAILSPLLSGIADYSGKKKFFMKMFCYIGSASTISLFFFDINHIELSLIPVLLGSVGYWGSIVFYNSYLPEIADPEDHDRISAKGYSVGYIGSAILLLIC
jgi:UMF1 family MFS transporter